MAILIRSRRPWFRIHSSYLKLGLILVTLELSVFVKTPGSPALRRWLINDELCQEHYTSA